MAAAQQNGGAFEYVEEQTLAAFRRASLVLLEGLNQSEEATMKRGRVLQL
jgi:hypothetical protein